MFMNFLNRKSFSRGVLLLLFLCTAAHAADEQRWLFVFDTSAAMKKRLPAVEAEIKSLLLSSVDGKLRTNDSVGVWTFDSQLHTGQFPLMWWQPERAALEATNLAAFLRGQKFSSNTKFDALQPTLNRVIADSERLTVLIFCDGADEIHWTPYDESLNAMLAQTAAERKKSLQPVVILLRTQMGKYVGATVNFPPQPVTAPPFPLLPREIKAIPSNPPPVVVAAPLPKPVAPVAPALVIVGTHVSSNTNDIVKYAAAAASNAVVVAKSNPPVMVSNPVAALATNRPVSPANLAAISTVTNLASATNAVAAPVALTGSLDKALVYVGAALLAAAVGLIFFMLGRRRGPRSSLITSSMQDDLQPPDRK